MEAFSSVTAKAIIQEEFLKGCVKESRIAILLDSLSLEPIAEFAITVQNRMLEIVYEWQRHRYAN
jgi:hypothetical protein|eukprot:scaffold1872_cov268-Chaetoceros_neogracile.AAC.21